jgi:CHAT domain-containing protein
MKRINWQRRWRTAFLGFLFCCGVAFSPIIAQARVSPPPVHVQATASNLLQQAQTRYQTGEYEQAAQLWQQLIDQYQRQGDDLNQGMALSNLSLSYQQLGEWQAAQQAIDTSLNLLQNHPIISESQKILAQSLEVQGRLQWEIGQSEQSIETWKQAAKIYEELGETAAVQKNLLNQAKALQDLGFYPKSCQTLLQIVNLETSLEQGCNLSQEMTEELLNQPQSDLTFEVLERLGNIERILGSLDQSNTLLNKSLEIAENQGDNQAIATTYLNLGNTAWAKIERDYRKALSLAPTPTAQDTSKQGYISQLNGENFQLGYTDEKGPLQFYEQAFQTATFPFTQLQAQLNILTLYIETLTLYIENEQQQKAIEYTSKAIDYKNIIKPPLPRFLPSRTSVYAQIKYANELIKLNAKATHNKPQVNQIDGVLKTAIDQAQKLGDRKAESYGLGTLGKVYEENKQWQLAQDFTQKALNLAPSYNYPELAYQLSWQLGRIHRAQGKEHLKKAIAAYTNAFKTLQSIRGDLVAISPEVQFSFRENVEPVYRELVDLLLEDAENLKAKNKQEELQTQMVQVREVIESLQLAELNNFFRDACVKANPQVIDKVSPTATVIYPIILEDRLEIVVSFPNENSDEPTFNFYTVTEANAEALTPKLREFRDLLALEGKDIPEEAPDDLLNLSQQIYNWLIQPIELDLNQSQVDTLVFVLDGEFRNIPMAALYDGEKYLVEKYQIALTPGLQLLNPEPLTQEDLVGLLAGATDFSNIKDEAFAPLPEVENELNGVSKELSNYEKRLNEEFTLENIQRLINQVPFGIVHLATHGKFGSSAEETFILAYNDRINVKNIDNLLRKPDEKNPIELLVLSACETVAGDDRAALGLAGVAVRAGARSTLASLWTVDDTSTASLMVKFYEELGKPDVNKAEALRKAQLKLLHNEDNEMGINTRHPYYWSPFILVGNWQ